METQHPYVTPKQAAAYKAWNRKTHGTELTDEEAATRLRHIAELFLLLGGARWLSALEAQARAEGKPLPAP